MYPSCRILVYISGPHTLTELVELICVQLLRSQSCLNGLYEGEAV